MEGNYEVYEYAIALWHWGLQQAASGTFGSDIETYAVAVLNGYDL